MSHFSKSLRPPRSLTLAEAERLLDASGKYAEDFQTHMMFSLAFGMGLRVHEIAGLNVGDVFTPAGAVRSRWHLRVFKGSQREGAVPQAVQVPGVLARKLIRLRSQKAARGDGLEPDAPLFVSRKHCRVSDRHMRRLLKAWLREAGLDETLHFHSLRHSALTLFYKRSKDIDLAQRFARHADIKTTRRYLHATDEDMAAALQGQLC